MTDPREVLDGAQRDNDALRQSIGRGVSPNAVDGLVAALRAVLGYADKSTRLAGLAARYQRKAASANARADRLEEQLAEERRKNQVLRSARSVALYSLHRVVRELEVFDDRFTGDVHTSTGTVKSEPPVGES